MIEETLQTLEQRLDSIVILLGAAETLDGFLQPKSCIAESCSRDGYVEIWNSCEEKGCED